VAISGKFVADFADFTTAVQGAETKLVSFETGASKVTSSLQRMETSLSGRKLIQDATLAVQAVENIGGVSKLTDAELQKLAAQASAAAAKMRAMGIEVPPGIQKIAAAADHATGAFGSMVGRIGEAAAGFFTAQAAINLLEGAFRTLVSAGEHLWTTVLSGASIADVEENFKHLTAQAGLLGDQLLGKLREGTHDTVTSFELMKVVNQNMAAGLNLTSDQFAILSKGAFALAQATGGDVKTALDTMSDAMVTGKTKALALLTGKIDLEAAETKYAASLNKSRDNLTDAGKIEAARIGILASVGAATQRLGEQTDGLDERVAQAQVAWANFEEELGKTIATSPVLEAGLAGVKDMLIEAFGGSQESLVKAIAAAVDSAAIASVEFAKLGVVGASMVAKEFITLKAEITSVALLLTGAVDVAVNRSAESVARFGGAIKSSVVAIGETVVAHAAIDASTAAWMARLEGLRVKMEAARAGTVASIGALGTLAGAHDRAGTAAGTQGEALTKLSDKEKAAALAAEQIEASALLGAAKNWEDFYTLRLARGATANELEIGRIESWAAKEFATLDAAFAKVTQWTDATTAAYEAAYAAIAAKSKETMAGVGNDFAEAFRTKSIPALQELATNALNTYNAMVASGKFFRSELDAQLAKYHELQDAARGYGKDSVEAHEAGARAAGKHTAALIAQKLAIDAAAEAEKRRQAGGSQEVTFQNFEERANSFMTSMSGSAAGGITVAKGLAGMGGQGGWAFQLAQQGLSFEQIVAVIMRGAAIPPNPGPRIPGFADGVSNYGGGWAMVGERGPEPMYVPSGASIFPSGSGAGGATITVNSTVQVSGLVDERTKRQLADAVGEGIVRKMMGQGWRPPLAVRR